MADGGGKKKRPGLKLAVADGDGTTSGLERKDSFTVGEKSFEAGDVRVDSTGLHMKEAAGFVAGSARTVTFEDLEEIRTLGSGASSTVKLARHKVTGELFALKCIGLYMKTMRDMLLTELRALFSSDCECLVDFYGATYREGQVAVILEFMDLGGLDGVLKRAGKIPERVLAAMCFQVCWALGYLAVERRVHRDIKPQNILVNSKGQVKLTDFGLSKEISTAVLAKTFVGSFKYMSPERMLTMPYGYSSDIWSLGLVLLECALGKYPYPESSSTIGYVTIVTDGELPLPPRDGTFTEEFHDLVELCLQKDPNERATAVQVLESPWLAIHGATSIEDCVDTVLQWLRETGVVTS